MKGLATTDPARATELLEQAPQLGYAIFQALLLMGLVSPDVINSVLDSSGAPPPPVQQAYGGYIRFLSHCSIPRLMSSTVGRESSRHCARGTLKSREFLADMIC